MGKYIAHPDDVIIRQTSFVEVPGYKPTTLRVHPRVSRDIETLKRLLKHDPSEGVKPERGTDLEFDSWRLPNGRTGYRVTIAAISTSREIWAGKWTEEVSSLIKEAMEQRRFLWVAHAGIGADKPVYEYVWKIKLPLEDWIDTMITHYACNQHLVKTEQKAESDDAGSLGLMDLWCATSLVTDMYNWKNCRGPVCTIGQPCPYHNPIEYCGVDSWAGNVCLDAHKVVLRNYGVPDKFIRMKHRIAMICHEMEERGIRCDLKYVGEMESDVDDAKSKLFPFKLEGKKEVYEQFNPRSSDQVISWFAERDITFPEKKPTEKASVLKTLEKYAKKEGLEFIKDEKTQDILGFEYGGEPSEELDALLRLYQYKTKGKGFDSWFGDRYLSNVTYETRKDEHGKEIIHPVTKLPVKYKVDGYIHPRFISVGTSTGRLSSSKPNATNFFGTIRKAIIAAPGKNLMKADCKQLELRVVLFIGGEPYRGKDVFRWLVEETGDALFSVAATAFPAQYKKDRLKAARSVAKSIAYGNLYGEGLILINPADLKTAKIREQLDAGALRIYTADNIDWLQEDWEYCGNLVGFTGVNMAERIFGEATLDNRAHALAIQEDVFFKRFNVVRKWQKKVMDFIQENNYIKTSSGQFIRLLGMPQDCAKAGLSAEGQGVGAAHVQGLMCVLDDNKGKDFSLMIQVHDEVVIEQDEALDNSKCIEYIRLMEGETEIIPGFTCPIEATRGPNWGNMTELYSGN